MTFTYTQGGATDKDRIRARIGDTDSTVSANQRLEDEELADFVVTEGGFRAACAAAAQALAAKFFRLATEKSVGQLRLVYQQRAQGLIQIGEQLRTQASVAARATAGGISIGDKQAVESDTDRVEPSFKRGMLDHP